MIRGHDLEVYELDSFGDTDATITVFEHDYLEPASLRIGPVRIDLTNEQLHDLALQFARAAEWRQERSE